MAFKEQEANNLNISEITLRDLFAAAALANPKIVYDLHCEHSSAPEIIAEWCYVQADAMLAERSKR